MVVVCHGNLLRLIKFITVSGWYQIMEELAFLLSSAKACIWPFTTISKCGVGFRFSLALFPAYILFLLHNAPSSYLEFKLSVHLMSRHSLPGVWAADMKDVVTHTDPSLETTEERLWAPSVPSPSLDAAVCNTATPYGVSREELEALSAMAYLVGSPLQRQQPTSSAATHPALLVAAKLLQHGVDPERIIRLMECRHETPSSP